MSAFQFGNLRAACDSPSLTAPSMPGLGEEASPSLRRELESPISLFTDSDADTDGDRKGGFDPEAIIRAKRGFKLARMDNGVEAAELCREPLVSAFLRAEHARSRHAAMAKTAALEKRRLGPLAATTIKNAGSDRIDLPDGSISTVQVRPPKPRLTVSALRQAVQNGLARQFSMTPHETNTLIESFLPKAPADSPSRIAGTAPITLRRSYKRRHHQIQSDPFELVRKANVSIPSNVATVNLPSNVLTVNLPSSSPFTYKAAQAYLQQKLQSSPTIFPHTPKPLLSHAPKIMSPRPTLPKTTLASPIPFKRDSPPGPALSRINPISSKIASMSPTLSKFGSERSSPLFSNIGSTSPILLNSPLLRRSVGTLSPRVANAEIGSAVASSITEIAQTSQENRSPKTPPTPSSPTVSGSEIGAAAFASLRN